MASAGPGGAFHVEVDGIDVTGPMMVPNTGGWQTWQTISRPGIPLTAGPHVLRVVFDTQRTDRIVRQPELPALDDARHQRPAVGAADLAGRRRELPRRRHRSLSAPPPSDLDGSVTQVAFYAGSALLGTDTTAPFTFSWTNVPVGELQSDRRRDRRCRREARRRRR